MKTADQFIDERQQEIYEILAPLRSDLPLSKKEQKKLSEKILVADENAIGIKTLMIEFVQYHYEELIKAIVKDNPGYLNNADIPYIKKSYPLENIK